MSNFLGESELNAETLDKRNQYHSENGDKYRKMGHVGLNMAKKANNFKQMAKANERMQAKMVQARKSKREERARKKEESAQAEFKVTGKEQIRKENRRSARVAKQLNR
mmetsp:Transcript_20583/g.22940  ORF Transcript_20583/g.22940 Transcript_20583/m.22940 type:complete len:108 (+) Transcript_20583:28-351(+)